MRGDLVALRRGRHLSHARDHGAAWLRAAANTNTSPIRCPTPSRRCARSLYPPLADGREPLERADGHRPALSRPSTPPSSSAATRPGRRSRRRCCCNTARATTIACIRTSTASSCSRCRSRSCCRGRAEDFTGGEFVLTEQRPRMQSRAEVVPLTQGEGVIFPVHHRPVQGTRGIYRVNMRHGVSRLRAGQAPHARRSSSTTRSIASPHAGAEVHRVRDPGIVHSPLSRVCGAHELLAGPGTRS